MLERYQGVMVGLAVGDALGLPAEFLSLAQIKGRYGPQGITDFVPLQAFPAGTFTDDTQMSVALAEGLLEALDDTLDRQMTAVARHFLAWSASPENNRAPGNTCMEACRRLAAGQRWDHSGVAGSKGCGSAMRSAPVGLLYHGRRDKLIEVALATSRITHGHPCALAGSVATALAVSLALDNVEPRTILEEVLAVGRTLSDEFVACVSKVAGVLDWPPEEAFAELGEAWVAEEAIADALYCFLRTPDDYRATVLCGANSDGDSDSIACIAGAISGARNGLAGIPAEWVERVEKSHYLHDLARRLYAANATVRA